MSFILSSQNNAFIPISGKETINQEWQGMLFSNSYMQVRVYSRFLEQNIGVIVQPLKICAQILN